MTAVICTAAYLTVALVVAWVVGRIDKHVGSDSTPTLNGWIGLFWPMTLPLLVVFGLAWLIGKAGTR